MRIHLLSLLSKICTKCQPLIMKEAFRYLAGTAGQSGFGSSTTAEQVTQDYSSSSSPRLTAVITGPTSGIGAETARVLAKRGVRIVMAARDLKKAAEMKRKIQRETPEAEIIVIESDLSSFASVMRFCSSFLSLGLPLNILINNAGMFSKTLELSEDKIELTFATNYLGHFLLTEVLVEKMIETAAQTGVQGRIINVTSVLHSWIKKENGFCFSQMLNPNNLKKFERYITRIMDNLHSYNGTTAYAQSKLANILHAKEMAIQLKARNARVVINAIHPGIVKTAIIRAHQGFITDSLFFVASKLLKSVSQGASTTCYLALSPQVEGKSGKYFADCNETYCSAIGNDESEARKLWAQTQTLIQRRLPNPTA